MRIAAGAVVIVVAMFALSVRAEDAKGDDLINWEGKRDPFTAPLTWVIERKTPPPTPGGGDHFDEEATRNMADMFTTRAEAKL